MPYGTQKKESLNEIVSQGFSEFQNSHVFLTFKNYPYMLDKFVYGIFQCYLISFLHFGYFKIHCFMLSVLYHKLTLFWPKE